MSQVRVRFAPSPTGFFHIGSARTALFNWLYARHTGGVFILRIEDTDKERNSEQFLKVIYDSLRWLGLNWDEGPQVGGAFGPYRQSERAAVYAEYLEKLKAAGRTYEKDGATWFKLMGERYEAYDEHRKKTVTKVKVAPTVIEDRIRGRVERVEDEDFVIVRSDGNPVFHFVNVVDDIAMRITHVIRGEDHLSNTSKHVELFKAFGAPVPAFAHIPLILKQNGPGKMSKRDQGALIEEYQKRGFLAEALVNFLCLLGWNPKDDREKMAIADVIALFDLPGVNQSNARFDEKKLAHMNTQYLWSLSPDDFENRARAYFSFHKITKPLGQDPQYFTDVMKLCQPKVKSLEDLEKYTDSFWTTNFNIDPIALDKAKKYGLELRIPEIRSAFANVPAGQFTASNLEHLVQNLAAQHNVKPADYIHTTRVALTGSMVGPGFYQTLEIFGPGKVKERIEYFIPASGSFSSPNTSGPSSKP